MARRGGRGSLLLAALLAVAQPAAAVEYDGVAMPDAQDVAGAHLVLNGLALRTYSLLRIHIYVAGLYLARRSSDPAAILASGEPRLLHFVFARDVGAEAARNSWRESLDANCRAPCRLPADAEERFLAAVPAVHRGDTSDLLFTAGGLEVSINGQPMGRVPDPGFARVALETFIGDQPSSAEVKRELLGLPR